jgi:acyl-CoA synthetase (AMP-forming)/AMP-acid ligase II
MSGTLAEVWRATVQRAPDARALASAESGESWTRRQLATAIDAWCVQVPAPEALPRRRVAMSAPNNLNWWTAFLGLLQLGAVPVPIDTSEPPARQRELAQSARCVRLWSGGEWTPLGRERRVSADEALVKLTSGSAGTPRAWAFTHAQMLADGRQVCATMGIAADDVVLGAIPLGHSYGLGNLVMPLVAQGTGVVLVDPPLPNVLAATIERWRCTVFPAVPPLLDALCRSSAEPAQLGSLRVVISAGARMAPALAAEFERRFGRRVHNFYGATETGGICYDRTGEATLSGRSVGSPLEGVTIEARAHGRFAVSSPAVCGRGTFLPADLGALNEHGELVLAGRTGRLVKIGARRLDLGEIEAVLRAVPQVREAYAAMDPGGRRLGAVVATDLSKDAVRGELNVRLASWKIPHRLVVVPALPVTPRGKPDRAALDRLLFGGDSAAVSAT